MTTNNLPTLELPKRWELLETKAIAAGMQPEEFVERVEDAEKRINHLLKRVRTGGGGLFEVFYGLSGSGKTTFLKTIPRNFEHLNLESFPKSSPLTQLPAFITKSFIPGSSDARIVLIERRDNPSPADMTALPLVMSDLLEIFREPSGNVVLLWPVTRKDTAHRIAEEAWSTGRDSMTDTVSKGFYHFHGLSKDLFYKVSDTTSRNLTGDGLDAFGVTADVAKKMLAECETIADFFSAVDLSAETQREHTWSILKARVRARLWVLLPGDLPSAIRPTVSSLTQGTRNRIDIDLVAEFIDQPDNKAIYVTEWRTRRAAMAHLLRATDVRLFGLPPNVSLAAARAFGDESVKSKLKQKSMNIEDAKATMKASKLYKTILAEAGLSTTPYAGANRDSEETANEYRRIQSLAAKGDGQLNKALGSLIKACLADDAPELFVEVEKKSLDHCELKPDVSISLGELDYICIEPTWRTAGAGIAGELPKAQNTLAEAHMKKYVLDKAMQYVKALNI